MRDARLSNRQLHHSMAAWLACMDPTLGLPRRQEPNHVAPSKQHSGWLRLHAQALAPPHATCLLGKKVF